MPDRLVLHIGEKNISSWSMRGFLAVVHKAIPFEENTISLRGDKDRSQRRAVSPTGKVPVLHHGDRVIPDSLAIIEYLEETFPPPAHPRLWPADASARAHARWLAAAMHSGFPNVRESMSFNLCFLPRRPQATAAALDEAAEVLDLFEDALRQRGATGDFLFGPFGAADIMYAPMVVRLTSFGVPTERAPRAKEYMDRLLEHPTVRRWMDPARALTPAETY
jgi:glutathione S-transferase